jgi:hypothetical protein
LRKDRELLREYVSSRNSSLDNSSLARREVLESSPISEAFLPDRWKRLTNFRPSDSE